METIEIIKQLMEATQAIQRCLDEKKLGRMTKPAIRQLRLVAEIIGISDESNHRNFMRLANNAQIGGWHLPSLLEDEGERGAFARELVELGDKLRADTEEMLLDFLWHSMIDKIEAKLILKENSLYSIVLETSRWALLDVIASAVLEGWLDKAGTKLAIVEIWEMIQTYKLELSSAERQTIKDTLKSEYLQQFPALCAQRAA